LQASDYRNIERLDIELREGTSVFVGDNAQGKSNLLEAVYLLATMRALRAETDAQLIRRESLEGVLPAARVVGEVDTPEAGLKLEVTVMARPGSQGPIATKTVKVNGVARRLGDAIGRLTAVLFTADDLELVNGSPSLRRRFLDTALSQIDARYAATRQRFDKVLNQRNHLLKRIREGESRPDELQFWDEQLCNEGALIFRERAVAVAELRALAGACHALLAPGETLPLAYQPRLPRPPSELPLATSEDLSAAVGAARRAG